MRHALRLLLMTVLLCSVSLAGATAQDASPEAGSTGPSLLAGLGFPELALTTDGETMDVPAEIEAGRYYVTLTNTGSELMADLEIYGLPEGITQDDLLAAFESESEVLPEWFFDMIGPGGVVTAPGETGGAIIDLAPGEWVFNLYTYNEDFTTNVDSPTTVTVTGEMPAVEEPEAAVTASMVDFEFEMPATVPAGPNVWKVENAGQQPHHMILFGLPDGTTEDEFVQALMMFFGPPASPEAMASPAAAALNPEDVQELGGTAIVTAGLATWVEFDLAPGTYAGVCFLPTPDGTPHVVLGMVQVFTVE